MPSRDQYDNLRNEPDEEEVNTDASDVSSDNFSTQDYDRPPSVELESPSLGEFMLANEAEIFQRIKKDTPDGLEQFILNDDQDCLSARDGAGYTPMGLAVLLGKLEMVERLAAHNAPINDAHLLAISNGNIDIAEFLLSKLAVSDPLIEFNGIEHSDTFEKHETPLLIAARNNDMEMMRMLFERKHPPIGVICKASCECKTCKRNRARGTNLSTFRRALYSSISSPNYILLTDVNPLARAFKLCSRLRQEIRVDGEYKDVYNKLIQNLQVFAADIIGECRTNEETRIILNERESSGNLPRVFPVLISAIHYRQTDFVVSPAVQRVVNEQYYGLRPNWDFTPTLEKIVIWLNHIMALPVVTLHRLFYGKKSEYLIQYRTPQSSLIYHFFSGFLFNVILFSFITIDLPRNQEGPPETGLEGPILLWIVAHTVSIIYRVANVGWGRFFSFFRHWYEVFLLCLFWSSVHYFQSALFHRVVNESVGNLTFIEDRNVWSPTEPTLLLEASFSLAIIFSFLMTLFFIPINYQLGTWYVSVRKMIIQIYIGLATVPFILLPVAAVLFWLYHNYAKNKNVVDFYTITKQSDQFSSWMSSIHTLFWTTLGQIDSSAPDIVQKNYREKVAHSSKPFSPFSPFDACEVCTKNASKIEPMPVQSHWITEYTGYLIYTFYCSLIQIGWLNTMIAVVTTTLQRDLDNRERQYKYARTKLILTFFNEFPLLPPPFNLLYLLPVTPAFFYGFKKYWNILVDKHPLYKSEFSIKYGMRIVDRQTKQSRKQRLRFENVMKALKVRYIQSKKRKLMQRTSENT